MLVLAQLELKPQPHCFEPKRQKVPNHIDKVQPQRPERAVFIRDEARRVVREVLFEGRVLVEVRHHRRGIGPRFEIEDDAEAVLVVGLIVRVDQLRHLLAVDDRSDFGGDRAGIDSVGERVDDDASLDDRLLLFVEPPFGPDLHAAAPLFVDGPQFLAVGHEATAEREVWPLDVPQQVFGLGLRLVDQLETGRDHFAQVVRRDVRRHADRDPGRAVDEQVRKLSGQHDRFVLAAVVVRAHLNRLVPQLGHELFGDRGESRFGVPIGGGGKAHDRAEVPLRMDQRVTERKVLCHPNERVIDRHRPVRVIVAARITGNFRALVRLAVGREAQPLEHDVQDATLHRLKTVAHVRQRARRDDRHRVVQVPPPRLLTERHIVNAIFGFITVTNIRRIRIPFRQRGLLAVLSLVVPLWSVITERPTPWLETLIVS